MRTQAEHWCHPCELHYTPLKTREGMPKGGGEGGAKNPSTVTQIKARHPHNPLLVAQVRAWLCGRGCGHPEAG